MTVDMKDIVALCKRRGFIFQASEIYGGINGFWDFGPLGTELKNNLRDAWWRDMVLCPPIGPDGQPVEIVGLDTAIIQNPKLWEASGHVGGFSDPMVDCKETKGRYREDKIDVIKFFDDVYLAVHEDAEEDDIKKAAKRVNLSYKDGLERTSLTNISPALYPYIYAPEAKEIGTLTEPKEFNLMMHTFLGAAAGEENKAYLRPETCGSIFTNFKNVLDSSRVRVPFGIAQIGKAFRNEVTPRNFIFRSREFEQMEMQFFCPKEEAQKWFDFWKEQRKDFWLNLGVKSDAIKFYQQTAEDLAHYAKQGYGAYDIEYRFPFSDPGYDEIEGIHDRCQFDLSQHEKFSGKKMQYMDPYSNEWYIPNVIETSAGLTRGVLALICEAYTGDDSRPSGMYLNFTPAMAPKKAAILPLTAKDGQPEIATSLYLDLRKDFAVDLDIKQNIGKRYARQDEIGTPYCFTIDNETVSDQTVTVRERNTMAQERIHLDHVAAYLKDKIS